jgi:hypothetical protein
MQAVSGSRGAAAYSSSELDDDISAATFWNATAQTELPIRGNATDPGMLVTYASLNLRDQTRKAADLPNQLRYLPADCRLYWTFTNFNNYTRLWHDVSSAVYTDPALCVAGSTNVLEEPDDTVAPLSRERRSESAESQDLSSYILDAIDGPFNTALNDPGVSDGYGGHGLAGFPIFCGDNVPDHSKCKSTGTSCEPVSSPCKSCSSSGCPIESLKEYRCLKKSNGGMANCGPHLEFKALSWVDSKVSASGGRQQSQGKSITTGFCYPERLAKPVECKRLRTLWDNY